MATAAWQHHCSELVVAGASGQVGVVARVMYDQVLEGLFPTPDDVAHAVATDERVRIVKSSVVHADDGWRAAAIEPIADETMSEARAERLADEAERAVGLLDLAVDRRAVFLEPSTLDDELGPPVCDPRSHPLAALQHDPPHSPSELSLWLAARLPLTTRLRLAMLASTCALKRMADTVDVLRLLLDPSGASRALRPPLPAARLDAEQRRVRGDIDGDAPAALRRRRGAARLQLEGGDELAARLIASRPHHLGWSPSDVTVLARLDLSREELQCTLAECNACGSGAW